MGLSRRASLADATIGNDVLAQRRYGDSVATEGRKESPKVGVGPIPSAGACFTVIDLISVPSLEPVQRDASALNGAGEYALEGAA
jgi:hypothetical protein